MKKVKMSLALLCLGLISIDGFSQIEDKMAKNSVVRGTVIKDGQEIEGYMRIFGIEKNRGTVTYYPELFQRGVMFMEAETFENAMVIKTKDFAFYKPKDISGYKYNGDSLIMESVHYADVTAVGPGMAGKKMFLRKVSDGKITLYNHFTAEARIQGDENATYVYRIGDEGKLKPVANLNVKKELADCSAVVEKFEKGEYSTPGSDGKVSKFTKVLDATNNRDDVRLNIILDYNNTCN